MSDADVLQIEPPTPPRVPPTLVTVEGIVRTDEMPCEPNGFFRRLAANGTSEKILNANPRRKLVVLQNLSTLITGDASEFIMIAPTKGQCDAFAGPLISAANALVRYELPWPVEMWARGINMTSAAGVITGFGAATNETLLNVFTFDWIN